MSTWRRLQRHLNEPGLPSVWFGLGMMAVWILAMVIFWGK